MTTKELFKQYEGREAIIEQCKGIVCGYMNRYLIMAVTDGKGWNWSENYKNIKTHKRNKKGYMLITPNYILPEK